MSPTDKEIKVAALKRLLKDREYYLKEEEEQKTQIEESEKKIATEELGDDSNEAYNLKNLKRIHEETGKLIPNITQKVKDIIGDIEESFEGFEELDDDIKKVLEDAKESIKF